jgi:hypothetical protein
MSQTDLAFLVHNTVRTFSITRTKNKKVFNQFSCFPLAKKSLFVSKFEVLFFLLAVVDAGHMKTQKRVSLCREK